MTTFPVLNFQDFISAEGEQLFTTSQQVAVAFGKLHAHVMRDIRALTAQLPENRQSNFGLVAYQDEKGESRAMYRMTRDGFTWLAMRFRGKKALAFQIAYTDAFNAMATFIKNQHDGLRYRCMAKELESKDSFRRGSIHGRGLALRKAEKPVLEAELAALQALVQPSLLN